VAVPEQLRPRTFWTVLVLALAAPVGARAQVPVAPPAVAPAAPFAPPAASPPAEVRPPVAPPAAAAVHPAVAPPAAAAPGIHDDDEGEPKLSLPTLADREAWTRSGFRMGLGMSYGNLVGLQGAPSGRLLGFLLRLGVRLDRDWSLLASLQYARASAVGGLSGLRYSGTVDPTWHATSHLSLAIGLGFGGIVEGSTSRPEVSPYPSTLATSYTLPTAGPPLPSCSGVGVSALARAEWTIVLGPRSSTSFALEAIGQWTGCVDDTGNVDPDTGQAIVRRQWWPQAGGTASWGFTWR
jgi:hypothetical protein